MSSNDKAQSCITDNYLTPPPTIPTMQKWTFLSFLNPKWPQIITKMFWRVYLSKSTCAFCGFWVVTNQNTKETPMRKRKHNIGVFCPFCLFHPEVIDISCLKNKYIKQIWRQSILQSVFFSRLKCQRLWKKEHTLTPACLWYLRGRRAIKLENKQGWRVQGDCLKSCVDVNAEFLERRLKTVIQAERSKVSAGFFICVLCCCFKPRTRFVLRSKSNTRGLWGD